ncbi:DUF3533 domain-containing protein [Weissella koreensis]|uniref:ABC transporter permease n=1 Tax=Weissella koreensis TaxID=165096 RepID=UPI0002175A73|nr:ABC transporter permease [Weissella koreensis]AEJ23609.1 membrane protein-like protein [Weissella koreensis KACC 15510]MCZ9311090.1 DUF3533 domain-containing protein [Weissella koreensis]
MFKNKFHILSLVVALIMGILLIIAQIPSTKVAPKNLPLAIVDTDNTVVTKNIVKQLTSVTSTGGKNATTIKWSKINSEKDLRNDMDHQKYYGALIIDKSFSKDITNLPMPNAKKPEMRIIINQAKNATVATSVQNVLNTMTNKVGQNISNQVITKSQMMNVNISPETEKTLLNPINVTTKTVHSTKDRPTASSSFFQPIWMGALLGTVMMLLAQKGFEDRNKGAKLSSKLIEIGVIIVIALVSGFISTIGAQEILGYSYSSFVTVAFFASLASLAFQLLMFGVELWIGMAGIPVFALLMLFSMPIVNLAPEMLTSFYSNWVMPWLPMRFLLDGMKSIVYYDYSFWNGNTQSLLWVVLIGITLVISSVFKSNKKAQVKAN